MLQAKRTSSPSTLPLRMRCGLDLTLPLTTGQPTPSASAASPVRTAASCMCACVLGMGAGGMMEAAGAFKESKNGDDPPSEQAGRQAGAVRFRLQTTARYYERFSLTRTAPPQATSPNRDPISRIDYAGCSDLWGAWGGGRGESMSGATKHGSNQNKTEVYAAGASYQRSKAKRLSDTHRRDQDGPNSNWNRSSGRQMGPEPPGHASGERQISRQTDTDRRARAPALSERGVVKCVRAVFGSSVVAPPSDRRRASCPSSDRIDGSTQQEGVQAIERVKAN